MDLSEMRRLLTVVACFAVLGGIVWAVVADLQTSPSTRDEPPAIILRAPEDFDVQPSIATSLATAVKELRRNPSMQAGVEFSEDGDQVILLADRVNQQVIEMRASRSGTIVERTWPDEVDRRLEWAAEHGVLDVPGLSPATGKNLYH